MSTPRSCDISTARPDRATLERILDAIPDKPAALVRTGDKKKFKELASGPTTTPGPDPVIALLLEHPD